MASAVNVLSGGESMENVYLTMIEQVHEGKPDEAQDKRTAEEIKKSIMKGINAISVSEV